jgi:hydroxyacylglutathione hydrolase
VIVETLTVGPVQTNCYLVGCEQTRQAALIDPGWDAALLLQAAKMLGLTIDLILITHAHFDHIGAVADVAEATGARVALHPLDLTWLHLNGGAGAFGFEIRSVPTPAIELAHGRQIEVGTLSFETRHVPGHTQGHVAFVEARQHAVFVGDVLFQGGIGRTDLPGGDYETLINSIRAELLTLPDNTKVYAGHGPPTTIGIERETNPFL